MIRIYFFKYNKLPEKEKINMQIAKIKNTQINCRQKLQKQNSPGFGQLIGMDRAFWTRLIQPDLAKLPKEKLTIFFKELGRAAVNRMCDVVVDATCGQFRIVQRDNGNVLGKLDISQKPLGKLTEALQTANLHAQKETPAIKELFSQVDEWVNTGRRILSLLVAEQPKEAGKFVQIIAEC